MKVETARPARAVLSEVSGPWSVRALVGYAALPLFRNAAYLWINTLVLSAFGFVFWTAAARLYPADAVGYGASAIAAMTLIAGFSHLGLGIGIIRFLPERRESGAALVNSAFAVTVATGLLVSTVFLLGLDIWSPGLRPVRDHPVFFATFVVGGGAFSLSYVLDQVFVATRRAHFVLVKNLALGALRVVLVVSLAVFFASFGIVAAHAVAAGVLVGVSLMALLPAAWEHYRPALEWKPSEFRSMLSFAGGNYIGALLLMAPGNLFTVMVLNTAGPEDAGYFYVAWTIGMTISALAVALSTSLFAEGSHDPTRIRDQAVKATIGGVVPAIVMALVLIAGAELVLRAFGSDYASNGATLLRLLALASLPYLLLNVYVGIARVEKRIGAIVLIAGTMATVSLIAGYVLVESMGLKGIGLAWIAGQVSALAVAIAIYATQGLVPVSGRPESETLYTGGLTGTSGGS
jgi:O-antigen/teichoic acid export membrane protein